jgi:hypothetical protein
MFDLPSCIGLPPSSSETIKHIRAITLQYLIDSYGYIALIVGTFLKARRS